jgi:uncharacterized membrane protein YoaK (UPF0700 family)
MANLPEDRKRQNIRTALVFVSVAVVFFFGVFAARFLGTDTGGLTVLGIAIVVFLVVAIGYNLRSRR